MTTILGISGFYHDSAAAVVVDGEVIAAAQEERFSRIKHDPSFPKQAIEFCLSQCGISIEALDHVAFYEKPFLKFERILETHLAKSPRGFQSFLTAIPIWLRSKLYISRQIQKGLGGKYRKRIIFPEHHESHAASAFFCSPFDEAAILTIDGVGEWATTTFGIGKQNKIELSNQINFPDSLGLLYSAFTYFCGFHVNGGEGKLMGLAPFGKPIYTDLIFEKLVDLKADGSFRLNQEFFNYAAGDTMTSKQFEDLFDGPPRTAESEITKREQDLAASIQKATETILLKIASHVHAQTNLSNLCIAGGVGLNCVANGRILRESPFEDAWIQPAAGDAGGAIGAALFTWHQLLDQPRSPKPFASPYLGPQFSTDEVAQQLHELDAKFDQFESTESSDSELYNQVAKQLNDQKIVGWFQGSAEFGPRALGNRSILADPRSAQMKDTLNNKVKFREPFRPFAPVILAEKSRQFFELESDSPFMLLAGKVADQTIPGVTHVDGSARIQTCSNENNPALYRLLNAFEKESSCSVLVNTSFNVRGEPIVNSIFDAYRCFMNSEMDVLVVENCFLLKSNQPAFSEPTKKEQSASIWQKLWRTWMTITFPLRYIVSKVALVLVFAVCILPIGIAWQMFNKTSFQPIEKESESYWKPRAENKQKASYFKQY